MERVFIPTVGERIEKALGERLVFAVVRLPSEETHSKFFAPSLAFRARTMPVREKQTAKLTPHPSFLKRRIYNHASAMQSPQRLFPYQCHCIINKNVL